VRIMPLKCNRRFSRNDRITRFELLNPARRDLDGFCQIVSIVKAQAHTTHFVSCTKKGSLTSLLRNGRQD
jgi:hypothetical protein